MAGHDRPGQQRRASKARPASRRVAQWTRDYVRLPGIPDEYHRARTARRARSGPGFSMPSRRLTPGEIERRFGSADRHLREAGVTYRAPGETADRLWPLSHLPLLIDEAEWQQLTAGIVQRAELLELVLGDLYGEGRLVAEGAIPAAAIAGSDRISARRSAASSRRAAAISVSMPPMSAADPTAAGGCWATAPRRRRAQAMRWKIAWCCRAPSPSLYKSMNVERRGAVLRGVPRLPARQRRPRRAAHRAADARQLQRNLFRARDAGALSRLPAGRGRRSRRQRRPHPYPHRRRPEAARRAAAPGRFQFSRSAGARRVLASRRARPDRRAAQERRRRRQHAGLRRDGSARAAGFPAEPEPALLRRRSEDAAYRDLVVRPESRARGSAVAARRGRDRGRLWPRRARLSRQRSGARRRIVGRRARAAEDRDRRSRHRLCRPGAGAAVDHAGVGQWPDHAAPVRAAGVRGRDAATAGPSCPAASAGSPSSSTPARCRWATARAPPTSGWSPTRRSRPRRCCRRSTRCGSGASPAVVPSRAADNLFWLGRYLERAEATLRLVRALGTPLRDPGKGAVDRSCTRSSASSGCW